MPEYEHRHEHPASARPAGSRRRRGTDLEDMVLAELQRVAAGLGINNAARMRKKTLIDLIREVQGEEPRAVTRTRRRTAAPGRPATPPPPAASARRAHGRGLEGMVLAELQQVASGLGIRGTARMRKGDLIQAIREHQGEQATAAQSTEAAVAQRPDTPPRRTRFTTFGLRAISLGTQLLPAAARDRWQEEWRAEWADLADRPGRARLMYLVRLTVNSAPRLAWSLRRASRREAA
ncbi:Rho termination factor N-terminal domain-containing protein [Streptomyces olindensis]|uniref:Rho termination factor N-terminal domain-containing protein n=1 Tax=Streptomyces olindensis TaxID=358823 RepID=UPI003F4D57CD